MAKSRFQEDALILIMIQDGAAEKFVETPCLAVNIPVQSLVMKVSVALANLEWIADVIVERSSDQLPVPSVATRSPVEKQGRMMMDQRSPKTGLARLNVKIYAKDRLTVASTFVRNGAIHKSWNLLIALGLPMLFLDALAAKRY